MKLPLSRVNANAIAVGQIQQRNAKTGAGVRKQIGARGPRGPIAKKMAAARKKLSPTIKHAKQHPESQEDTDLCKYKDFRPATAPRDLNEYILIP